MQLPLLSVNYIINNILNKIAVKFRSEKTRLLNKLAWF